MKVCFKCNQEKELAEFYKHKGTADGYLNKCKECTKIDAKLNKNNLEYGKTEKGVIRTMYKSQKANSKRRGHTAPNYTKEEFKEWLYEQNFKELYDNWVESGYEKKQKPSCDRLNDFKGYSFDNMILITWELNAKKQYNDILTARSTSGKMCKQVTCHDSNNNLIAVYVSFSSAKRAMGYSMERPLKTGKPCRKNNFLWKYT